MEDLGTRFTTRTESPVVSWNELDTLLDMKLSGHVNDEEYQIKKEKLSEEKIMVLERIKTWKSKAENWLPQLEEAFNFTTIATEKFNNGTWEDKKYVLSKIGSNFQLKDGKLLYDLKKPYFVFKDANEGKYDNLNRLELVEYASVTGKNGLEQPKNLSWLARWNDFRTFDVIYYKNSKVGWV